MKKLLFFSVLIVACNNDPVRIDNNTFAHKNKVYKIVDNEVLLLGELDDQVKLFSVTELDSLRDMGVGDLSFIKKEARTSLKMIYRGSYLYYRIVLDGFQDDFDKYGGEIFINFYDKYEFIFHTETIAKNNFTKVIDAEGKVSYHRTQGKIEMSSDIYKAIDKYDVSSNLTKGASSNTNVWQNYLDALK